MRCEDLLCQLCPRIPLRGDLLHQNSLLLELFIEKEKKNQKWIHLPGHLATGMSVTIGFNFPQIIVQESGSESLWQNSPWLPRVPLSRFINIIIKHGDFLIIIWQGSCQGQQQLAELLPVLFIQKATKWPNKREQVQPLNMKLATNVSVALKRGEIETFDHKQKHYNLHYFLRSLIWLQCKLIKLLSILHYRTQTEWRNSTHFPQLLEFMNSKKTDYTPSQKY